MSVHRDTASLLVNIEAGDGEETGPDTHDIPRVSAPTTDVPPGPASDVTPAPSDVTPGPSNVTPAPSNVTPGPAVICPVCSTSNSLDDVGQRFVVTCTRCGEAVPTRPAPPGVRYLRCQCHCLVICQRSDVIAVCPRQSCKRQINLGGAVVPTGKTLVNCAYCQQTIPITLSWKPLVKCPRCERRSIMPGKDRKRQGVIMLTVGLVILAGFIIGCALIGRMENVVPFLIVGSIAGTVAMYIVPLGCAFLCLRTSVARSVDIHVQPQGHLGRPAATVRMGARQGPQ